MLEGTVVEHWPNAGMGGGLHLLGEWYECAGQRALLEDTARLRRLCLLSAGDAGLGILGHLFRESSPQGVAGAILLTESHLAIRTRLDERSVMLDLFVAAQMRHSRLKARTLYSLLKEALMPKRENFRQIG